MLITTTGRLIMTDTFFVLGLALNGVMCLKNEAGAVSSWEKLNVIRCVIMAGGELLRPKL